MTPLPIATAVQAWNLMGGIDWSALPIVIDLLGVSDPEASSPSSSPSATTNTLKGTTESWPSPR
ncbi:hypothetical protein E4Q23_12400 [Candidatus Accumulibacter phosphatis]|uniref:Uncharacterized protein n=1 Tax=Candidatus Accumulibacter phosphatis TaxID=327160 RepID=A0ABX1TW26_9PROT|nr:hypothetical protein [Candidatus Accumulibacter phosphatis]NMQ28481.1 hypothetical protein [Candidatus Accumulibacter phosphatis]